MDLLQPTFTSIYNKQTREQLKNDFIRVSGECYVDHAGATLHSDNQMKKIFHDLTNCVYPNPHSGGGSGNITQEIVERTRYRILDYFNASSDEYSLVFTSGTTSSLKCIAESFKFTTKIDNSKSNANFVYLQDNHTSVLGMRDLVAQRGAKVTCLTRDDAFDNIFNEKNNYNNNDNYNNDDEDHNLNETLLLDDNSLYVYPAQCNFSGFKYPLDWVDQVHEGALNKLINSNEKIKSKWFVLLDAACYVGTNRLDLSVHKFDFVVFSFYKMFGYPTAIGAMIVRNDCVDLLDKVYYGGGTVNMVLSLENCHIKRQIFHERFEDGTIPFLSIISLQHGFDTLTSIPIDKITTHVFSLAQYLHHSLITMHHHNGNPVVKLYTDSDYHDKSIQGGIIAFNLLRPNGKFIGFMEVFHMATLFKIHLRTGCFCNPGACQRHLNLSNDDVINNHDAGVKCGGGVDLIDGKPTGACRFSFGYMSTVEDVDAVVLMIRKCFLSQPEIRKIPEWFGEQRGRWDKKYGLNSRKISGGIDEQDNIEREKNCRKNLFYDTDDEKNKISKKNDCGKFGNPVDDNKIGKSAKNGGGNFLNGISDDKNREKSKQNEGKNYFNENDGKKNCKSGKNDEKILVNEIDDKKNGKSQENNEKTYLNDIEEQKNYQKNEKSSKNGAKNLENESNDEKPCKTEKNDEKIFFNAIDDLLNDEKNKKILQNGGQKLLNDPNAKNNEEKSEKNDNKNFSNNFNAKNSERSIENKQNGDKSLTKEINYENTDKNSKKTEQNAEEKSINKIDIKIKQNGNINLSDSTNNKSQQNGGKKFLNTEGIKTENLVERKNKISITKKNILKLKKIFIYPIKSCAAYEIETSWNLTSKGLQYDREWMIVTSSGISLTQKQEVTLCLLKPTICLNKKVLKLDYPGMPTIILPLDISNHLMDDENKINKINGEMCRSRVCGHRVEGIDCGDEVSEWLSLALGRPKLKLIRQSNFEEFKGNNSKPELSFSSQAQYLLINKASIEWLVNKIPEDSDCDRGTVLERFRGNLIVEGGEPFEEENWRSVKIGKQEFEVNGPCTRCQMVCIDQTTGIKTIEPLRLLAEEFNGKMKFGIYLSRKIDNSNRISIGDSVIISN